MADLALRLQLAMRATLAKLAIPLHLAVRARVAFRAVSSLLPVLAGHAGRAVVPQLPVGAPASRCAARRKRRGFDICPRRLRRCLRNAIVAAASSRSLRRGLAMERGVIARRGEPAAK